MFDYRVYKQAINRYFTKHVDGDNRPTFFNIDKDYPSLNTITENFSIILEEFEYAYNQQANLPRYHEIDPGETAISDTTDHNWNVFMLYLLGFKPKQNRSLCPQLCKLLEGIPNLVQAFFSILDPGKSVPLHTGPYLGYLRYHLGLHVPEKNPPKIIVNSQDYIWQEGEGVLFDDSWPHEVINSSSDYRAVLIIDVLRPMATIPTLINKFVTNVVARQIYGRQVMKRLQQFDVYSLRR